MQLQSAWVGAIGRSRDGWKILLQRRNTPVVRDGKEYWWGLCGGGMEAGESLQNAAFREGLEEMGVDFSQFRLWEEVRVPSVKYPGQEYGIVVVEVPEYLDLKISLCPVECSASAWMALDDVLQTGKVGHEGVIPFQMGFIQRIDECCGLYGDSRLVEEGVLVCA